MEIFENVANLVASKLKAGTIVETKGYHTAGDGGGAKYLIQTSGDYGSTPDGYRDHALANTNVAVLQHNGEVNAVQAGLVSGGSVDNSATLKALMTAMQNEDITGIFIPEGEYLFSPTIGATCLMWDEPSPFKFQGEPTKLSIRGAGSASQIVIDDRSGIVTWMAGTPDNNVPDVHISGLGFISKTAYDSETVRTTYSDNFLTMPTYGRVFNCGRMWRCTIENNHFEYVQPFYHDNADPESPNSFVQQLKILNNNSVQHQKQFIDFYQCWSCDIIGNNIESGNRGIKVSRSNFDAGYGLRIHRNTIQGNGLDYSGIRINHGYSIEIHGNYFESNRTSSGLASVNLFIIDSGIEAGISIRGNFFAQNKDELDAFGAPFYHILASNLPEGFISENNTFVGGNGYVANNTRSIRSTDKFEPEGSIYSEGSLFVGVGVAEGVAVSWTPIVSDAGSGGNVGTATTKGSYCLNGDVLTVSCKITNVDTTGMTPSNILCIQGLPFNANTDVHGVGSVILDQVTVTGAVASYIQSGTDYLQIRQYPSAGSDSSVPVSALSSGTADISITVSYIVGA